MSELGRLSNYLWYHKEAFAEILADKSNKDMQAEKKRMEGELQKAIANNPTIYHWQIW